MRLRHVATSSYRRLTRRYPFLRYLSLASTLLTLVWLYTIYNGERQAFGDHIEACHWDKWEQWPQDATPHHLVFIADPQLVDPHTYPGRPWPLSSLTETYTDLYMTRNFRLLNQRLDPDSVVFLGDLFDGGREWSTTKPRYLRPSQRQKLIDLNILHDGHKEGEKDGKAALYDFKHGEDGRWSKWGNKQWVKEYQRFGRIFFTPEQLYPKAARHLLPTSNIATDPVAVENGAKESSSQEYSITGRKHRQMMTSLPGNHDLGFGADVQLSVRDRFQSHFGDTNNVYVLGNHTFVSLDTVSLSAFDEYIIGQGATNEEQRHDKYHIWRQTNDYLDDLTKRARAVVDQAIHEYYPNAVPGEAYVHDVLDTKDVSTTKPHTNKDQPELPVVLLSHVPLFRSADTDCGRLREKGKSISISRGYQYQNVLTPGITSTLAQKVSAVGDIQHVFSGDDHDYCDITHRFNVGRWDEDEGKDKVFLRSVREITVKSFSWAMGVRKPGFQLVSLWNPVDENGRTIGTPLPTIQSHLCLLPDQLSIFISYGVLLGWTLAIMIVRAIIIGIRNRPLTDDDDNEDDDQATRLSLPRFKPGIHVTQNGKAVGNITPERSQSAGGSGRQRASSTSTSTASGNNNNLSVQRSYNARTRSVSPGAYSYSVPNGGLSNAREHASPLIEKAGYYPQMRWQDPDESDEESHIGDDPQDSQGKKRKRPPSRARRALDEFVISVAFVAIPSGLFYGYIIRRG